MKIDHLRRALREGRPVRDEDFDAIYPLMYRQVSARYWTPIEAARRAATLLVDDDARRVLDVGAGVGKFCLVGAASSKRARFVGLEQRRHLVHAAHDATRRLGAERVEIIHGHLDDIDTSLFDAFYFYNPFGENLLPPPDRLDDSVHLSHERFRDDVRQAAALLASASPGTRVVTYYGFGGRMPPDYELVHAERRCSGALELWIKGDAISRAS